MYHCLKKWMMLSSPRLLVSLLSVLLGTWWLWFLLCQSLPGAVSKLVKGVKLLSEGKFFYYFIYPTERQSFPSFILEMLPNTWSKWFLLCLICPWGFHFRFLFEWKWAVCWLLFALIFRSCISLLSVSLISPIPSNLYFYMNLVKDVFSCKDVDPLITGSLLAYLWDCHPSLCWFFCLYTRPYLHESFTF